MRESRRDPYMHAYFAVLMWALAGLSYVSMLKKRRVAKRTHKFRLGR